MKYLFDFDNIELDDYDPPFEPSDSTHSKILTVYCDKNKTDQDIREFFETAMLTSKYMEDKNWKQRNEEAINYFETKEKAKEMLEQLLLDEQLNPALPTKRINEIVEVLKK